MAFDCYCALCGVGFSRMRIESTSSQTPLDRRRRWIEKRSRALKEGGPFVPGEDPVKDYDARVVDAEGLSWISKAHCLGQNQDSKAKAKAFISGPGYYADAGELAVKIGTPPKRAYFTCYALGTDEAPGAVMPFHWCCFEILLRTLTGGIDPDSIKPDVLYDALSAMCNVSGSALQLDYGRDVAHAQGQYWQCIPGAEYSVKHPTNTPALSTSIQAELQGNDNLRTPYTKVNLKDRQPKSPFGKLPVEMVDKICSFLPGDSLKALIEASLFVQVITQENYFWKRFIQYDMPWLWEMQTLQARDDLPPDLNYKLVHSWLDKITTPEYGMNDSAWMGIANRRRIWNACEQVAPKYFDSLG